MAKKKKKRVCAYLAAVLSHGRRCVKKLEFLILMLSDGRGVLPAEEESFR